MKTATIFLIIFLAQSVTSRSIESSSSRIINGQDVGDGEFASFLSYQVSLLIPTIHGQGFCSGAIITKAKTDTTFKFILTAAHCLQGVTDPITVAGGRANLTSTPTFEINTSVFYRHPNYTLTPLAYDLALIELPQLLTLADYKIKSIPVTAQTELPLDQNLIVTGWGSSRQGSSVLTNNLQKIYLKSVDCRMDYPDPSLNVEIFVCANSADSQIRSTCNGDSGSPLKKQSTTLELVGIASFIHIDGCESGHSIGFTSLAVPKLQTWISGIVSA